MRMRLTVLYTGLFLVTMTIALTVVNLLISNMLKRQVVGTKSRALPWMPLDAAPGSGNYYAKDVSRLPDAVLHYQWTVTTITIAVLTVVSVAAGWWLAGRLLRPLRHITATAHRLSLSNLHERIALTGPHDELRDLADTFDAMLERLERSVDSQRRFIANAAHELRTPLATQRAAIQIGLDDRLPDHLTEVRQKLLTANQRTERLIDSLLLLAQAEHGLDTTQPVALDLLTRQAADEMVPDGIIVTLDTQPATVPGDPVLLHRLLTNLFQNAVKYNHPDGTVHVNLTETGTLTVRNTGPDVPAERITELFLPFRRLHTRTRATDGAGLGLSIVASIAQAHHATLDARPNPGGGLELTVRFPALAGTGAAQARVRPHL
ncbi:HAMP domain-containing protein [Micromonospora sp. NEAU-HG-1]|nr:HAMP domain-containing protein [Micromonospora rubida]